VKTRGSFYTASVIRADLGEPRPRAWILDSQSLLPLEPDATFMFGRLAPFLSDASVMCVEEALGVGFDFISHRSERSGRRPSLPKK
jgi:hypothetical protein